MDLGQKSIFGRYPNQISIDRAIDELKAATFTDSEISLQLPQSPFMQDLADEPNFKTSPALSPKEGIQLFVHVKNSKRAYDALEVLEGTGAEGISQTT